MFAKLVDKVCSWKRSARCEGGAPVLGVRGGGTIARHEGGVTSAWCEGGGISATYKADLCTSYHSWLTCRIGPAKRAAIKRTLVREFSIPAIPHRGTVFGNPHHPTVVAAHLQAGHLPLVHPVPALLVLSDVI